MIEERLERVPTVLRNADDQHVVIIAQKVAVSGAAVDVALDSRAYFGYQLLRLAVHQDRQPQDVAADHQPQNLGGNQTRSPVRFLR